jgi:energy-coupling factor transporter ATP-binding protein EcfA2
MEVLRDLNVREGKTVILVSHDANLAAHYAHRTIELMDGHIQRMASIVKFTDAIDLSLRNLRQSRLRTSLTTLGVSIGIASLAGMISLGIGLEDQVVGRFKQSGLFGSITVTSQGDLRGALAQLGQRGGLRTPGARGEGAPSGRAPVELDGDAIQRISALQKVREVTPNLRLPVEATIGEFSSPVIATGTPMSSKRRGRLPDVCIRRILQGRIRK